MEAKATSEMRCDRCESDRVEYVKQTGIICRDCRYAYGVVNGEWKVTGFNTNGWVDLTTFRTEIDKTGRVYAHNDV